jgi:hypothetical protein
VESRCTACGRTALFIRKAEYDGFTRIGEYWTCSSCGARRAAAPAPPKPRPALFAEVDRPAAPNIFGEEESRRLCRHCAHYLVNPFTQRCFLHQRTVEATDSCPDFTAKG